MNCQQALKAYEACLEGGDVNEEMRAQVLNHMRRCKRDNCSVLLAAARNLDCRIAQVIISNAVRADLVEARVAILHLSGVCPQGYPNCPAYKFFLEELWEGVTPDRI